jgi:hypothetical protein
VTTLAIMTCPGRDYLRGTLRALEGQPWSGRKLLWSDGPCELRPHGWEVVERDRRGPPNSWPFLDLLRAVQGGDLLLLQDDVTASPGALAYIERMGVPSDCAFVSWFDPISKRAAIGLPFTLRLFAAKVLPAQARTYPRATIARLIERAELAGGGDDDFVSAAAGDATAFVHVPSLFRHDGVVSSVGSNMASPLMRSESWLGPGYDVARGFAHVQPSDLWGGA